MVKRKGHTSFETVLTIIIVSILIVIAARICVVYIQDARVTKAIAEVTEEDKMIREIMISIYSKQFTNTKSEKLTGEYIVKQIKKNSNRSLKIYIVGEQNPEYDEQTADMVIYLSMESDDGTVSNPVIDNDISESEMLSIKAYRITGRYGVYMYNGELYQ